MRGKYKKNMEDLLVFLRPSPRPFVGQKGGGGVSVVDGSANKTSWDRSNGKQKIGKKSSISRFSIKPLSVGTVSPFFTSSLQHWSKGKSNFTHLAR